ncbi:hypothetical protein M2139_002283 [Enterococcus sp. PF1-24]|uniref:RICIN domain-containing protein n=1 Tax=unclassified Enterococcus TaxID=2608891 RepID=UPI0024734F6E|nr:MULTISPECIES: RICIN domain-containing protein [unclassified Enterococcus]MDH6365288.1 hypothetical protein [Enterococcus sp. PFB1-1]MDH6402382.1 hypothetical protein [Enterococcus sp. PF1-24]
MKKKVFLSSFIGLVSVCGFALQAEAADTNDMHRLYNPNSGEHFYTANVTEKNNLIKAGWNDEGLGWIAPTSGEEVYRLYNGNSGDHHYTLNEAEKNNLVTAGWKYEGIGWYSSTDKELPLYRAYNPNAVTGTHNYTTSNGEQKQLLSAGWNDEGIAWYACGDANTPVVEKSAVTVEYLDEEGKVIEQALVDKQAIGKEKTYTAPKIAGYRVIDATKQTVKFTEADQTIQFVYQAIDVNVYQITIAYQDEAGKKLKNSDIVKVEENDNYTAKAATIAGYNIKGASQQVLKGIVSNQTVTFVYTKPAEPEMKPATVQDGARYFISASLNKNLVLEVGAASQKNGANVQLWTEVLAGNQKFTIRSAGAGWYRIENDHSKKVLDIANGSNVAGANVQQMDWNNSDAQKFRFLDAGNGECYIQSKLGTYLGIANKANKNGANIEMQTLNKSAGQKFRLENLSGTNYVRSTVIGQYEARVTVFNPNNNDVSSVSFPTWSQANGQDDMKWINGTKNSDNSWSAVINSRGFRDGGTFETHVYGKKNADSIGLGMTSYILEKAPLSSLQQAAQNAIAQTDGTLAGSFNWVAKNLSYIHYLEPAAGTNFADWYATQAFSQLKGDCYCYAAAFYHMAKMLGYDAHLVSGRVQMAAGGTGPHGWVEININGTTYVFDPESRAHISGYNGYQVTYGAPGTLRYQSYQRVPQGADY